MGDVPEFSRHGEWLSHKAANGRGFRHTDGEECPVCRGEMPSAPSPAGPERETVEALGTWIPDDQHGYSIALCVCEGGPYLGSRQMGTPCCCERCGRLTREQVEFLRDALTASLRMQYEASQGALSDLMTEHREDAEAHAAAVETARREGAETAWDEGYAKAVRDNGCPVTSPLARPGNPYRDALRAATEADHREGA